MDNFIREIKIKNSILEEDTYYKEIKALKGLETLKFSENITFFVGENGTGKSTLLEGIAIRYGFNPEGGSKNFNFSTSDTHSNLYEHITLVKNAKIAKDGYFLRAESFYNVATEIDLINEIDHALNFAYGGKSMHKQSHGESFLSLIVNRFHGNGLYILDEPEAALSPNRQLSLLVRMKELVDQNSQFIIATHSPILLGISNSEIYSFDNDNIRKITYEETESYKITKLFLENRELMLHNLFI